jgi:hypothetical protein
MNDTTLLLTDLEAAINYWRLQRPATGEECALSPEVNTLANVYAVMIIEHLHEITTTAISKEALQLLHAWRASRADSVAVDQR